MVTGATERHYMVTGATDCHYLVTGATERHDMVTGGTEQTRNRQDMVTEATEQIGKCHDMTGVHEEVTYCPPSTSSGKQKKNRSTVNSNSAVTTPLRQLKQTKSCWPFSSWQIRTILQIFIITSTEFPNCQNRSRQRCPCLTGNLKNLSCLKTYSRRVSKFIFSWPKMTESITSILSWREMRYKPLNKLMAQPERT